MLEKMVAAHQLEFPYQDEVRDALLKRHTHQYQHASNDKGNADFMKRLTPGSEASNILVGEVDFLNRRISTFIRLKNAEILGDLTEVPVPTRFLFVLLGPTGHGQQYREIGRAIATLMSDEDGDRFWKMPEVYVRGATIKYLRIPDEVLEQVRDDIKEGRKVQREPKTKRAFQNRQQQNKPGPKAARGIKKK